MHTALPAPSEDFDPWPYSWREILRQREVEARVNPYTLSRAAQSYVPASVEYLPNSEVIVSHALGAGAENHTLTCIRLSRKGYTIIQRNP